MTAREIFAVLGEVRFEPALRRVQARWCFNVRGAGKWYVIIDEGTLRVGEGVGHAELVITAREEDFIDVVMGKRNLFTTVMQRRMHLRGDIKYAVEIECLFACARRLLEARASAGAGAADDSHGAHP